MANFFQRESFFRCLMSLCERSIDSIPYVSIRMPMVFHRKAFTSELRSGYDRPFKPSWTFPVYTFILDFECPAELRWELTVTPNMVVTSEWYILVSPKFTRGVICGGIPMQWDELYSQCQSILMADVH